LGFFGGDWPNYSPLRKLGAVGTALLQGEVVMSESNAGAGIEQLQRDLASLVEELSRVVVGQREAVEGVVRALVVGGHVLLEGVPGLGKTVLVEASADAIRLTFQRIQFTPDLMPADLLGTYVVMESAQGRRTFEFQKGPIFAHLILADQLNRGLPKTQSALLEAMEGGKISVADETLQLPRPFFVMATQNPLEMEGTYPLPEPQLDRFLMKLIVRPPSEDELEQILARTTDGEPPRPRAVLDTARLLELRRTVDSVRVDDATRRQAVAMIAATHPDHPRAPRSVRRFVRYGASPRGAQSLIRTAKAAAASAGRATVGAADLAEVALPVLRHRLLLSDEGLAEDVSPDRLVDEIVAEVLGIGANASSRRG